MFGLGIGGFAGIGEAGWIDQKTPWAILSAVIAVEIVAISALTLAWQSNNADLVATSGSKTLSSLVKTR